MSFKMHHFLVGISLTTGLALNSIVAPQLAAQTSRVETVSPATFCENQLQGEVFTRTELFFGLSKPDGSVITESEFQAFLDTTVTPLFPDGLTLLTGTGQFKSSNGTVVKEGSKLLILLYTFSPESNRRVQYIRQAYKNAFQQESVLRTDESSCTSF
jgi:Protein of unknown function (DUF3574)